MSVMAATDRQPLQAFVLMGCASCGAANEVAIPVGEEREFTVQCHTCKALSIATLDTGGEPLVVAEGMPEWSQAVVDAAEAVRASIPPKKRQKPAGHASRAADETALHEPSSSTHTKHAGAAAAKPAGSPLRKAAAGSPLRKAAAAEGTQPTGGDVRPAVVKRGSVALALFGDGYYYTGVVEALRVSVRRVRRPSHAGHLSVSPGCAYACPHPVSRAATARPRHHVCPLLCRAGGQLQDRLG